MYSRRRQRPKTKAQELLSQSRSALVMDLQQNQRWLRDTLDLHSLDDRTVHDLLKLFGKCLSSRIHKHSQQQIATTIVNSNFLQNHVDNFLKNSPSFHHNNDLFNSRISCLITVLELLPKFVPTQLDCTIDLCQQQLKMAAEKGFKIDRTLTNKLNRVKQDHHSNYSRDQRSSGMKSDYKHISVLPTVDEITGSQKQDYRPTYGNRSDYRNFWSYLSTQFHILREVVVEPLRCAIKTFLSNSAEKLENAFVYEHVYIKVPKQKHDGALIYELHFDIRPFEAIDWENSPMLCCGSLLCLSADAFKTVAYATIYSRSKVSEGILYIRCLNQQGEETDINNFQIKNITYLMAESPVCFDLTSSVLKGLQTSFLTHQNYLIEKKHTIMKPKYLEQKPTFDLSNLLRTTNNSYQNFAPISCNAMVIVTDIATWPTANELGLDESQREALHKALTSSVAVINAPPGTGKTFMGQKIAQILLHNDDTDSALTPILVLCPTNDELDKFLKGIVPFTDSFIRVGGQTQETFLDSYSLLNAANGSNLSRYLNETKQKLTAIRNQLFEKELLQESCKISCDPYENTYSIFKELVSQIQLEALQKARLIGMTANAAAKYQPLLQELGCKIIIVENAAQISEAQISVVLTPKIESLILIGDHKQLKPVKQQSAEHVHVSLFERLITHKISYVTLNQQYRMRPDISQILRQHKYPKLLDDRCVSNQPNILGMGHNVFFVNHEYVPSVDESNSGINTFEAEFVVRLSGYLLLQGYTSQQITILTPCSAQALEIQKKMPTSCNEEIHVAVIDCCQVANDIILLSLADNNGKNTSFLKNISLFIRALSRANLGLYVFGNLDLIKADKFCQEVLATFENKQLLGPALPLVCQRHQKSQRMVANAQDFVKYAPGGGCLMECKGVLECGHPCSKTCHAGSHSVCLQPCERKCARNHPCNLLCSEPCALCMVTVKKLIPCGHIQEMPCSNDTRKVKCHSNIKLRSSKCGHEQLVLCYERNSIKCRTLCDYRLECGHKCHLECHTAIDAEHENPVCKKPCERNIICERRHTNKCKNLCHESCASCPIKIKKKGPSCLHIFEMECGKASEAICSELCNKSLPCGHKCKQKCIDKVECTCTEEVKIDLPCRHSAYVLCKFKDAQVEIVAGKHSTFALKIFENTFLFFKSERASTEVVCSKSCLKLMDCGHACQSLCNVPCRTHCEHGYSLVKGICGHQFSISCKLTKQHPDLISQNCNELCRQELPCSHKCRGTCKKCFQGRVHIPCEQTCGRIQICGHACEIPCAESCPPCDKKCPNRCPHSKCSFKCGRPCISCIEPCQWKCRHFQCTKLCGEDCNREPCDEPCLEVLRCGHPCIGLCGEVCPTLCRIYDHNKLVELILSGMEEELDSRFVMLEDCGHCIEVSAMDHWMNMDTTEIGMKSCPRCKTTIWRSERYGNITRQCLREVQEVKQKIFGKIGNLREMMIKLHADLTSKNLIAREFSMRYKQLELRLKQQSTLHYNACNVIENQISLLNAMAKVLNSAKTEQQRTYCTKHVRPLADRLMMHEYRVSPHELEAIRQECRRVRLCVPLIAVDELHSSSKCYKDNEEKLAQIRTALYSGLPVSEEQEKEAKKLFKNLMSKVPGLDITDEERLEIVNAIDVGRRGHWFKCPNGHPYAIGECGGAMERSRCIDCGAPIGGERHALVSGNMHAGEMDGSQYATYSQRANLNNFDPRNIH